MPKTIDGMLGEIGIIWCHDKPSLAYVQQVIKITKTSQKITELDSGCLIQKT